MDAAALATLSRLLDQALSLSPDQQRAWLDRLDPDVAGLRPQLERLLTQRDSGWLLSGLPPVGSRTAEDWFPEDPEAAAGTTIGPYRLVRPLGAGGMGAVWIAERSDGIVQRPVALKLPRGAWRQLGLAERMAREREILAGLNHPHIARLYDAGITAEGQPYMALEYVDGRPIDMYCRERAVPLAGRLRLFLQVLAAVAHAHARLVVHRDLKPSNILVTPEGDVRLLDFGIAKLLAPSTPAATLTERDGRVMTPDYASPEQISGAPIGTTSDVYSLGVVFYELLTGVRPYRLKRDTPAALEEAILEVDPLRPSQAAQGSSLRRALAGDLDWIVARALAKAPEARYQSAEAFAADIERHLRAEPIAAAAPGRLYRLGKFSRRHRTGLAAAAVVSVALVAGIVGTTAGLLRARAAEADAQKAASAARTEATTADRVTRFLLDLFDVSAAENADGRAVTAREMLDRGAVRARDELTGEPLVRARMLQSLGNAYSSLGLYQDAQPILIDAVAAARSVGAAGRRELAQSLLTLGQLQRRLDDATAAEGSIREALALDEELYGSGNAELGPALNELAMLLRTKDPDQAIRLYQQTYDLLVRHEGPQSGDAAVVLANIGSLQSRTRRYAEARESLTRALGAVSASHGAADPRVAGIVGNLALTERELGNYRQALEYHRRDLELSSAALGSEHPVVGTVWLNMARTTQRTGDYETALSEVEKALAIFGARVSPRHSYVLTSENSRALYLDRLGRSREARRVLEDLLTREPESAEGRAALLATRLQLADLDRRDGRYDAALRNARVVAADPAAARDLKLLADASWSEARTLARAGDAIGAERARETALEIHASDPQATDASRLLAEARYAAARGHPEEAIPFLREAIAGGFSDPGPLVEPGLAAVRALPSFAPIAGELRARTAAAPSADR